MDIRTPIKSNGGDWISKFGENWKLQISKVKAKFGPLIEDVKTPFDAAVDVPVIIAKKEVLIELLRFLKSECEYNFLADLTATDETPRTPRFDVVYQLFSVTRHWRIRVKTKVEDKEEVPSIIEVWPGANWAEREVFDMFGIKFTNHPDLRRILMDERWEGHPLRKDYPLRGYQVFTEPMSPREELLE
jgi:NADH-quinone oxidoreductase subunit C